MKCHFCEALWCFCFPSFIAYCMGDAALFEAQKKEFEQFTNLYHEKLTRMYLKPVSEEEASFDQRIHAIWDEWDVSQRAEFIQKSLDQ